MHDASDFVRAVQQVSDGANAAGYPADVMSGTVIAASPLKIKVEQRFDIDSAQLIVPERLTDYKVSVTFDGETEKAGTTEHFHKYGGEVTMTVRNALESGDKVALIRQQGGQKFLIIDRVV